ncbi:MAG: hypothetical protein ACPGWR_27930, partial [Ardenticatenaceae bacterium]
KQGCVFYLSHPELLSRYLGNSCIPLDSAAALIRGQILANWVNKSARAPRGYPAGEAQRATFCVLG